jgi:predicted transcriptional regulator
MNSRVSFAMGTHRRVTRSGYLTPEEAAAYKREVADAETVIAEVLARRKLVEETGILPDEAAGPGSVGDFVELNGFVTKLRGAREAQGLSLADLSERTGIDRSALSKLENRKNLNPTFATLARYADAVGLRITLGLTKAEPRSAAKTKAVAKR